MTVLVIGISSKVTCNSFSEKVLGWSYGVSGSEVVNEQQHSFRKKKLGE